MPENDTSSVGQDMPYKEPVDKYDSMRGRYNDSVENAPLQQRIPNAAPAAADPTPYRNLK